jgi:adenylyltransferase/sulfurtransferase
MQAAEAIKFITGVGELLSGKLFLFDLFSSSAKIISIAHSTSTPIQSIESVSAVPTLTVHELRQRIDDPDLSLIDVREQSERDLFNIGGEHIPLSMVDESTLFSTHKKIVLYCATGSRSAMAARIIQRNHPELTVYSLDGGLKSWQEIA